MAKKKDLKNNQSIFDFDTSATRLVRHGQTSLYMLIDNNLVEQYALKPGQILKKTYNPYNHTLEIKLLPDDHEDPKSLMHRRILTELTKNGPLTDRDLWKNLQDQHLYDEAFVPLFKQTLIDLVNTEKKVIWNDPLLYRKKEERKYPDIWDKFT